MVKTLHLTRRVAGEFLLIIVGVLTAFALEAWWSARAERHEQEVYLHAIALEFDLAVDELNGLVASHRLNVEEITALRGLLLSGRVDLPRDSVVELSSRLWRYHPFSPSMPVYVEFKESGGLSRVVSEELARAFFAYEVLAEQNDEFDGYVQQSMIQSWEPVLSSRIPFVLGSGEKDWARRIAATPTALASDLEFMNLMGTRLEMERRLLESRTTLLAAASDVRKDLSAGGGSR